MAGALSCCCCCCYWCCSAADGSFSLSAADEQRRQECGSVLQVQPGDARRPSWHVHRVRREREEEPWAAYRRLQCKGGCGARRGVCDAGGLLLDLDVKIRMPFYRSDLSTAIDSLRLRARRSLSSSSSSALPSPLLSLKRPGVERCVELVRVRVAQPSTPLGFRLRPRHLQLPPPAGSSVLGPELLLVLGEQASDANHNALGRHVHPVQRELARIHTARDAGAKVCPRLVGLLVLLPPLAPPLAETGAQRASLRRLRHRDEDLASLRTDLLALVVLDLAAADGGDARVCGSRCPCSSTIRPSRGRPCSSRLKGRGR